MNSPLTSLFRNEVEKALRRKLPYFGVFAIALGCVIIYFIGGKLSSTAAANAWGYVGFSMQMVFSDIGPICIVGFATMLMSEETGTGTIRAALAAPVHRWELYVAKAAAGLLYMVFLSAAAMVFSGVLGCVNYRFGTISDAAGVVYGQNQVARELMVAWLLSWVPLSALVMYGLLISTIIRSPGVAVAVGISSLFLIEFTKHLVGIDAFVFTRHISYPWLIVQQIAQGMDYQWRPEMWNMMFLSSVSGFVMFAAGLVAFARRDLNH